MLQMQCVLESECETLVSTRSGGNFETLQGPLQAAERCCWFNFCIFQASAGRQSLPLTNLASSCQHQTVHLYRYAHPAVTLCCMNPTSERRGLSNHLLMPAGMDAQLMEVTLVGDVKEAKQAWLAEKDPVNKEGLWLMWNKAEERWTVSKKATGGWR